jgi:hypothetical protein
MGKSRWFFLFLAGAAILSFTQFPYGSMLQGEPIAPPLHIVVSAK